MLPENLSWTDPASALGQKGNLVGGVTPLHLAAEKGFTGMITFLLENKLIQDVNPKNDLMTTPLHVAVRLGNYHTIRTLLQAGADINAQDAEGFTPVHVASSSFRLTAFQRLILEDLLAAGTYNHNLVTNEGQRALHVAAR